MRIGLFTDTYTPDINGVVTSVLALKQGLERAGHTVFVITTHPSVTKSVYEDNVLYLPGLELKFLYGYKLSSPIHLKGLEVVQGMDLDIIHAHSEFGIGIFGRIVAKNLKIPMVSTYHTQYEDYTHYVNLFHVKRIDALTKKAVASLSRLYSKNVSAIIAPSEKTKHMLMGYDIRKEIVVIPTGLDFDKFKKVNKERVNEIKDKYNLHGKFVITNIGRIAEEKSLDLVLKGFKALCDKRDDVHLMIVGGGPQLDDLKSLAKKLELGDSVTFVGPVSPEYVPSYYHASNAFISASLTETQGLTYIEALASGLVVFARFDKPLEEIVLDEKTGFLFTNPEDFVEKAIKYIEMSEDEKNFMRSQMNAVLLPYDLNVFTENILAVYQKAINTFHGKYKLIAIEDEDEQVALTLQHDLTTDTLVFDKGVIDRRELELGMELSRNEINSLEEDQKVYEAYQLSIKRIALKDYTSFEISEYIKGKMNLNQEEVETVIEYLKHRHFIDDERYLEDKVSYLRHQNRGNQWIINDLVPRGFFTQEVEETLALEPYDDYLERGLSNAKSFYRRIKEGSALHREYKLKQHLQREGYENDIIDDILLNLSENYSEEEERNSLRYELLKSISRYKTRFGKDKLKRKVIQHALSKGYAFEEINEVLKEIEINED